jgi:hypothetical protein
MTWAISTRSIPNPRCRSSISRLTGVVVVADAARVAVLPERRPRRRRSIRPPPSRNDRAICDLNGKFIAPVRQIGIIQTNYPQSENL